MPKGVYERTIFHRNITKNAILATYRRGDYNEMGFKKGHKSFLTEDSRKKMSKSVQSRMLNGTHNFCKGHPVSSEMRKKISKANRGKIGFWLGKHHSIEARKKMSESAKGRIVSTETRMKMSKIKKGFKHTIETKIKLSKAHKGKKLSLEHRKKLSENHKGMLGKHPSEETRKKMSEAKRGEKGSNWRGGITPEHRKIRQSIEYRLWREAVFSRDNWTCQICHQRGGKLNAHHIESFEKNKELRTSIENGITYCYNCHLKFHKSQTKPATTERNIKS